MSIILNSLSSENKCRLRVLWDTVMGTIDMAVIYKILAALKELGGAAKLSDLQARTGYGWGTLGKYVEYMKAKGLVEEERHGKARIIRITRKGEDFIFLFSRILSILAEI